ILTTRSMKPGETRREMAQHRRRRNDPVAVKLLTFPEDFDDGFDDVVDMALCVDPPRNRKADELHRRRNEAAGCSIRLPEHHAADFHRPDPGDPVEFADDRLPGKLFGRYVREE